MITVQDFPLPKPKASSVENREVVDSTSKLSWHQITLISSTTSFNHFVWRIFKNSLVIGTAMLLHKFFVLIDFINNIFKTS